jgi:hypothetical protein
VETLVGFAVGFVVGTKEGRKGLAKILESWTYIRESKEVQDLVGTGLGVLVPIMRELGGATGRHA